MALLLLRRRFSNKKKNFFSTLAFTASSTSKFCSIVSDPCSLQSTKQARRKIVLFTNLHKIFQERLICVDAFAHRGISYVCIYLSIKQEKYSNKKVFKKGNAFEWIQANSVCISLASVFLFLSQSLLLESIVKAKDIRLDGYSCFSSEFPEMVEWLLRGPSFGKRLLLFDDCLVTVVIFSASISFGNSSLRLRLLDDFLRLPRDLLLRDLRRDPRLLYLLLPYLLELLLRLDRLFRLQRMSTTVASPLFMHWLYM